MRTYQILVVQRIQVSDKTYAQTLHTVLAYSTREKNATVKMFQIQYEGRADIEFKVSEVA